MTTRDFVLWLKEYLVKVNEVPQWHILLSKINSITDVQTYPIEDVNHLTKLNVDPNKVIHTHPRMIGEDGIDNTAKYFDKRLEKISGQPLKPIYERPCTIKKTLFI